MGNINTFELVFDIQVEKFEGKIRAISKIIKIDGVQLNSKYALNLKELSRLKINHYCNFSIF